MPNAEIKVQLFWRKIPIWKTNVASTHPKRTVYELSAIQNKVVE